MVDNKASWLGETFVKADGSEIDLAKVTAGKVIIVVYTASWWPGCQPFKEKLKGFYKEWNKNGLVCEVVILSCDNN